MVCMVCCVSQAAPAAAASRTGGSPERWTDCLRPLPGNPFASETPHDLTELLRKTPPDYKQNVAADNYCLCNDIMEKWHPEQRVKSHYLCVKLFQSTSGHVFILVHVCPCLCPPQQANP